jgi:hypothetical protein
MNQSRVTPETIPPDSLDFSVRPSQIEGAGNGLWCIRREGFKAGVHLTDYSGTVLTKKEFNEITHSTLFCVQVRNDLYVDAYYTQSFGRYCNTLQAADMEDLHLSFNTRLVYDPKKRKVSLKSITPIAYGSELFLDYGEHFWDKN